MSATAAAVASAPAPSSASSSTVQPTKDPALSLITETCTFTGDVKIGPNCVFQNHVKIESPGGGSIIIGRDNIFEDRVNISNRSSEPLVIGDGNVFGTSCLVEGSVGSWCTIEPRGRVKKDAKLGDNVVVVPMGVAEGQVPSGTVVYSAEGQQRTLIQSEAILAVDQKEVHKRHIEYLRDVLPRYNKTRVQ